ncbi:uncharacterized protein LOC143375456 isoform X2 [Andrena cerasifolii]|uniref:uncharacterized protein LOC143375456 isoform X2 n=1 Tax=Andrena cerasifolii TaxID=2819439 RepID=UPI0040378556
MMSYGYPHPVSKTYQYKKTEGEDISKLEKADILELTVRHLQRLQSFQSSGLSSIITKSDGTSAESRWLSGFGHCAAEAYRFLLALPGEGAERLARHLAAGLQKSRQTDTSVKTNLLRFPMEPCLINATIQDTSVTSSNQNATVNCGTNSDAVAISISSKCNSAVAIGNNENSNTTCISRTKNLKEKETVKRVKVEVKVEDDEEIDVEHVDKADPMWRPW